MEKNETQQQSQDEKQHNAVKVDITAFPLRLAPISTITGFSFCSKCLIIY